MAYQVRVERRPNAFGVDDRVWVLIGDHGNIAEISPSLGFNCYRWQADGVDILYADPRFFAENRPTRSGIPILFPFPNRIRGGSFAWQGRTYQLPLNDSSGKNAIHGFACRRAWRVVDQGSDHASAWVTGEFHGASDAPETIGLWPADYRIRVRYSLGKQSLSLKIDVDNPDQQPLPFGLGFHPYFALAAFGGDEAVIRVAATSYWELENNLPTGRLLPVAATRDLRGGRPYGELHLDDILTNIEPSPGAANLSAVASVEAESRKLVLHAAEAFRDMVVFTPPHRQSICLEPYSCVTDAINLHARVEAGLNVLEPGGTWSALLGATYCEI